MYGMRMVCRFLRMVLFSLIFLCCIPFSLFSSKKKTTVNIIPKKKWKMAGKGSKKAKRRAKKAGGNVEYLPAEEFYSKLNDTLNEIPPFAKVMDGLTRELIHSGTIPAFTRRLAALPCVIGKNLVLVQLLLVDEQKTAQLKLYALGSKVALTDDDSNVVKRSRKLFKDAAPSFMNDFGLWIFSRSLVRKAYNGSLDSAALDFSSYDPLQSLLEFPMDPSSGTRCAEIFMFFAVDSDVQVDLSHREAMLDFLDSLNSQDGIRKIHAFSVTAGSVVAKKEKLHKLRGKHQSA